MAEVVRIWNPRLRGSKRTFHLMAKAAVAVLEAVTEEQPQEAEPR